METNQKAEGTTVRDQVKKFLSDKTLYKEGEVANELIIRTGEAEVISYPKHIIRTGVISSPRVFFEKRKDLHDPNKCHLTYDKQLGVIHLVCDEQNDDSGYEIIGKLLPNKDLEPFGLAVDGKAIRKFDIKSLMEVLKFNRVFFVDKDLNAKIVTSLMSFKAKVQTEIEAVNNQRGDQRDLKATKLSHELDEFFVLKMPIFKGLAAEEFRVDILCEVSSNGSVCVWLESKDLAEQSKINLETVIDAELKTFENIVCIEQ